MIADPEAMMQRAIAESRLARGVSTPNPPVGAVIVAPDGTIVGSGRTGPPGDAHAEAAALAIAGEKSRGATVFVTLEPCDHTGRTGPCSMALIEAGVAAVHYAVGDPNPLAAGGAHRLRAAGIDVDEGLLAADVRRGPLREWLFRQKYGRPHITAKFAATLDGRLAAADGTSRWITGRLARERVHASRAELDAIVVGTGTVVRDDPLLTARRSNGTVYGRQPLRVILGKRDIDSSAKIFNIDADTVRVRSRDPRAVLDAIGDVCNVQVEGGPTVLGAFFAAGLIDAAQVYLAPTILGAGAPAVSDPTVATLAQAHRLEIEDVEYLGDDLLLSLTTRRR